MTAQALLRLFLLAIPAVAICGQTFEPVDVCALFREPARWNGVMIRVQGVILTGAGEGGPWLTGENCSSRIEVKGNKFPNIIELADPQDRSSRLHAVNFQWDEASRQKLNLLLQDIYGKQ